MIKYRLKCAEGHAFDSWFASAGAFDALASSNRLSCAICGNGSVEKAMMAPRVTTADTPQAPETAQEAPLRTSAHPAEAALAAFRAKVEAETEDVGRRFTAEARAMHAGDAPERAIRGQARPAEARALLEDGVPILPLPFPPTRQVN